VYIDLFAGCGGLSLGLRKAGWEGLFAVEKSPMAFSTLQHNLIDRENHFLWPDWLPIASHDIDTLIQQYRTQLMDLRDQVDLVVGGPPCQGFSTAGKRQRSDKRNTMVISYLRFIDILRPKALLFENVRGFTMPFQQGLNKHAAYADEVFRRLAEMGYSDATAEIVDFSEFGVPQRRQRFILVATCNGMAPNFFEMLHSQKGEYLREKRLPASVGASAAIGDLEKSHGITPCPDSPRFNSGVYGPARTNYQQLMRDGRRIRECPDSHRYAQHRPDTEAIFSRIINYAEPNVCISGQERARYGIRKRNVTLLGRDSPSMTLMSIPDDCVHYSEPRILTVREYARLQSFPDSYEFKGNYTTGGLARRNQVPRYTQIGNAVPPLFAEFAGRILRRLL
jgi:DNA (cytosine-5)-methyltransferase 1